MLQQTVVAQQEQMELYKSQSENLATQLANIEITANKNKTEIDLMKNETSNLNFTLTRKDVSRSWQLDSLSQTSIALSIAVDVLITQPTPAPAQIVPTYPRFLIKATRDFPRETEVSLQQTKIALDTAALKVAKEQAYNAAYANYLTCKKLNEGKFMACTQPSRP
jgi:hypothetical protein